MGTIETNVYCSLIIDCIREMIELARRSGATAKQELNRVTVMVNGDSDAELVFRDQQRAQSGYIVGDVGPYPRPKLTAEDVESDARIAAENERRWAATQTEYARQAKEKADTVAAKLAGSPLLEIADDAAWQEWNKNNRDAYGGGVIAYAERWGRLMQSEMAAGKLLEEIADPTSHEADTDGITGFMYGAAVSVLASCWEHGEQLRRWHNLKTQIGSEGESANESGGVLNPAMFSIRTAGGGE
jgi:hypothetical protein